MNILSMADLDLADQRVLIREDLNVPIKDGKVTSAKRIQAAIPTIQLALDKGAKVILLSHLGRPTEGKFDKEQSLQPIANYLKDKCNLNVRLEKDWLEGIEHNSGEIVLCENVRFQLGEKANDDKLAKKMAKLCDVFVMDAFGTAHRAQASTHGVAKYAPIACAGPLLKKELDSLQKALLKPARPMVAIVGGSKVSTKLTVLETLMDKVDQLILGGGIVNTFLAATGKPVGKSLYEQDLVETAKSLLKKAASKNIQIPLPTDVVCAKEFSQSASATTKLVEDVSDDDMILDIGPVSSKQLAALMENAGTIVWNGPVGVFEFPAFANGTEVLATAIANSKAFSIAGGGDTLAAVDKFGLEDKISYISTGGGAFLEYLEGKVLPAVEMLEKRASQ
jgi:phosphoglycerate kinase